MMLGNNCKKLNSGLEYAFLIFTVAKAAAKSKWKLSSDTFCADSFIDSDMGLIIYQEKIDNIHWLQLLTRDYLQLSVLLMSFFHCYLKKHTPLNVKTKL